MLVHFFGLLIMINPGADDIQYQGMSVAAWREKLFEPSVQNSSQIPPVDFPLRKTPDPEAIPMLLELLKDDDSFVRLFAMRCIGYLGRKGEKAIPAVIVALRDPKLDVEVNAAYTLGLISTNQQDVVSALLEAQKSKSLHMRVHSSIVLLEKDKATDSSIRILTAAIKDWPEHKWDALAVYAINALGDSVSSHKQALPVFREVIANSKEYNDDICIAVVSVLGNMKALPNEAGRILEMALDHPCRDVRIVACQSHWKIQKRNKPILATLVTILNDNKTTSYDQKIAIDIIKAMGPGGEPAIPCLERLRNRDDDEEVRKKAESALESITPKSK